MEKQEINQQENIIHEAISDKYLQSDESIVVKKATDSLSKIKENKDTEQKRKEQAEKILTSHKLEIKNSILGYFKKQDVSTPNTWKLEINNIMTLKDVNQITAYQGIIKRLNEWKKEEEKDIDIELNTIDKELWERKQSLTDKKNLQEKTDKEKPLNDLLLADPSMDRAKIIFENNEPIWNNLFNNTKEGKISLGTKEQQENMESLLKYYSSCTNENWENRKYKDQPMKDFSYEMKIADKENSIYNDWEKYIQVTFTITTKEGKTIPIKKDIIFWKRSNVIEEKRAAKEKKLTIKDEQIASEEDIKTLQDIWSYERFRNVVKDNKVNLKKSFQWGLIENIKKFYEKWEVTEGWTTKIIENKEDGYYTTIAELVVKEAQAGKTDAIQEYLKHVNKDNMEWLWRNKAEQEKNLKILVNAVNKNPNYNANSEVRKDITGKLTELTTQVFPAQDFLTKAKNWLKPIFDAYGETIIKFLNFLWVGKSTFYKICKTLGIDTKEVDEYYTKAYGLSEEATTASNTIQEDYDTLEREDDAASTKQPKKKLKPFDAKTLKISFNNTVNTKDHPFLKDKEDLFLKNMNPTLLSNLIDKYNSKNKNNTIKKQDVLVTNKDNKLSIKKDGIDKLKWNKTSIIKTLLDDGNTWSYIREANRKITWYVPSDKKWWTEKTRSDLDLSNKNRSDFTINKPVDIVKYLNYYAFSGKDGDLDYVVSESGLSNGEKVDANDTPQDKKLTLKNTTDFDNDGKLTKNSKDKKIHEVIDVANSPDKLQIVRGATIIPIEKKQIGADLTYSADGTTKVSILQWDKVQEVPKEKKEEVKITDGKIYNITKETSLRKEWTTESKTPLTTNDKVTEVLEDGKTVIKKGGDLWITDDNKDKEFIKVKKWQDMGYVPKEWFLTEEVKK